MGDTASVTKVEKVLFILESRAPRLLAVPGIGDFYDFTLCHEILLRRTDTQWRFRLIAYAS